MKRFSAFSLMIAVFILLAGCTAGKSAPPPPNVTAVAGDSNITVSWDAAPGVEYWLFFAPTTTSVTPDNCSSIPGCQIITAAVSPVVLAKPIQGNVGFTTNGADGSVGLTNGRIYSITVNGRTSGGPGGSGSPSISAVPRLAGSSWSAGTALAGSDLLGMTHGTAFVAVGAGGGLFSSPDGINWTALLPNPVTTDLNAVTVSGTTYVAVGAGGVILTSPDTMTWTPRQSQSPSNPNLNGVASNGAGYVAVGDGGTIVTSSNGMTWSAAYSGTLNNLYGVAYANGKYVAVGQAGTLLTSTDGNNWAPATFTSGTPPLPLKSVAYGGQTTTDGTTAGVNTFVAIGSAGTLVTSTDGGLTWQLQPQIGVLDLNAVTYGHQFVAVGNNGAVYTSTDGINWSSQASGTSTNIYAIAHGLYDYSAVGATGLNLHSM